MKKELIVLQDGIKECGSAALLSLIRYYGGNIPISKLVELTKTTKEGTNFLNLQQACLELGFNATGYSSSFDNLLLINKPFIAQLKEGNYTHFVVVYKIQEKILIMDPAKGSIKIKKETFISKWTSYILIIEPYKTPEIYNESKEITKIIIEFVLKNKKEILNISILGIMYTLFSSITTYHLQIIIDYVIGTTQENLLIITYIFLALNIYKITLNYLRNKITIYLNKKLDLKLIISSYNKILYLPYNYYKNKTTGETVARINDIVSIKNFLSKLIITVQIDILITISCLIISYLIYSNSFIILIIVTTIYVILTLMLKHTYINLTNNNQINNALLNSKLIETINNYETIKGLNIEKNMSIKFEKLYIKLLNSTTKYEKIKNDEIYIKDMLINISIVLILYICTKKILNNNFEISKLITFYTLYNHYITSIKNIIELDKEYYYAKNSLRRANNLFEIDTLDQKRTNLIPKNEIKITNLSYSYGTKKILNNINLTIRTSEKVLLLGKSGSGKSTLLKILFKYYKIKRDNVFINNIDLCDYTIFDIREYITYISQKEMLFNDTIKNNIILDRNISEDEFEKIIKLTYINDIVKDDMLGYNKQIEENGVNLSGGERQRIILARALLKKSNIILIDEGLSEMDIELERRILENIFKYYNNKTIIIVSHRLNNISMFDKVARIINKELFVIKRNMNEYN